MQRVFGVVVRALVWLALVALVEIVHASAHAGHVARWLALAAWPLVGFAVGLAHAPATRVDDPRRAPWRRAARTFAIAAAAALLTLGAAATLAAYLARGTEGIGSYWAAMSPLGLAARVALGAAAALPLVAVGAWTRAHLRSRPSRRRHAARAALVLAIAATAATAHVLAHALTDARFDADDRIDAFDDLVARLRDYYGHWDYAPVTAAQLAARWRPRIVEAARACDGDPCVPYLSAIRDALAELEDAHTGLTSRLEAGGYPALDTDVLDGQLVVTAVVADSDAARAHVQPGARIVAVDGEPAAAALAAVPAWRAVASSPRTRDRIRARAVLAGPLAAPVALDFADGTRAVLARGPARHGRLSSRFAAPGVLVIAIPSLGDPSVVAAFDRALDQPGVRALVLDLRGNGGGNSAFGDGIVGRLVERRVPYGRVCYPPLRPPGASLADCGELAIAPRAPHFAGKLAALVDGDVVSSGEFLAAALCDTHVARCFGRTTAGGSGHPTIGEVPGGAIRFSTRLTYRLTGDNIERGGVPPDVPIAWHVEDLLAHRDPDLDAALDWLAR